MDHVLTLVKIKGTAVPKILVLITYVLTLYSILTPLKYHVFVNIMENGAFASFSMYIERSGSVVECLTLDRRAAGSSLTSVTAL